MPTLGRVDHVALSVTDLARSQAFYTDVLGFVPLVGFGDLQVLLHEPTGLQLSLVQHTGAGGEAFDEHRPGLDHLAFSAASRSELVEWSVRLEAAGVVVAPIQDRPFGHHLNFRDPDGIALELLVPHELLAADGPASRPRGRGRHRRVTRSTRADSGASTGSRTPTSTLR